MTLVSKIFLVLELKRFLFDDIVANYEVLLRLRFFAY